MLLLGKSLSLLPASSVPGEDRESTKNGSKCQETLEFIWILIAGKFLNKRPHGFHRLKPQVLYLRLTFSPKTICFSIDEQELCFVNFITCPL
jgi:hypothetical protein